jgi:hypothetical protein
LNAKLRIISDKTKILLKKVVKKYLTTIPPSTKKALPLSSKTTPNNLTISHCDRYLGMMTAMTSVPVPMTSP